MFTEVGVASFRLRRPSHYKQAANQTQTIEICIWSETDFLTLFSKVRSSPESGQSDRGQICPRMTLSGNLVQRCIHKLLKLHPQFFVASLLGGMDE
jgi:hypothetical protein